MPLFSGVACRVIIVFADKLHQSWIFNFLLHGSVLLLFASQVAMQTPT